MAKISELSSAAPIPYGRMAAARRNLWKRASLSSRLAGWRILCSIRKSRLPNLIPASSGFLWPTPLRKLPGLSAGWRSAMLRPCWKMMVQSPFWERTVLVSPREQQHRLRVVRVPAQEMALTSTKLWRVLSTSPFRFSWMRPQRQLLCRCRFLKVKARVLANLIQPH